MPGSRWGHYGSEQLSNWSELTYKWWWYHQHHGPGSLSPGQCSQSVWCTAWTSGINLVWVRCLKNKIPTNVGLKYWWFEMKILPISFLPGASNTNETFSSLTSCCCLKSTFKVEILFLFLVPSAWLQTWETSLTLMERHLSLVTTAGLQPLLAARVTA